MMVKDQYKLGLVSVSFRSHTPREIVEAMKAVGLSYIEWGSDVHAPCHDAARLAEIAELQKMCGIECSSYGTYFRVGETPIEELLQYIAAAKILGTDILRIWCGRKSGADMTEGERDELLSACRKIAAMAEESGVTVCLECHRKTFTENPDDAVWLMEAVDSAHFRTYWQPFQWQSAERNTENAKKIAPYAAHVHVFNWKGEEKLPLCLAGEEWQGYLRELRAPRTLLLEFMPCGGMDELAGEAAALKNIIGETL